MNHLSESLDGILSACDVTTTVVSVTGVGVMLRLVKGVQVNKIPHAPTLLPFQTKTLSLPPMLLLETF